jgi:predicted TIM-barrel fold metal-dependent hydrolase
MGGAGTPPLDRSALEAAARHPNITLIGSAIDERAILGAIDAFGPERVCFGSDMPFRLMHVVLAMYRAMLRDFDETDQAKILGGNLTRVLGLG